MSGIKILNSQEAFNQAIDTELAVIHFTGAASNSAAFFEPLFEEEALKRADQAEFYQMDAGVAGCVVTLESLPTFIAFKHCEISSKLTNPTKKRLLEFLDDVA